MGEGGGGERDESGMELNEGGLDERPRGEE